MIHLRRTERGDLDPTRRYDQRKLAFGERRTAILHYSETAKRDAISQAMLERNDTVDHELHEPIAFGRMRVSRV